MTRQNGSIIGEKILGENAPGMWTPSDVQQRIQSGDWGEGTGYIQYFICGGGGGGGGSRPNNIQAGGGGGGGVVAGYELLIEGRSYNISIGNGGPGGNTYDCGSQGGYTIFNTTDPNPNFPGTEFAHYAYGGGGGGSYQHPAEEQAGGSGGGASNYTGSGYGLNPTTPTPIANPFTYYVPGTTQGYNGGPAPGSVNGGAGGGGAGSTGGAASPNGGGGGGSGMLTTITGSNQYYGAGGGGGGQNSAGNGGTGGGGVGGGGRLPSTSSEPGISASGYGGGGGGASTKPGAPSSGVSGGNGTPGICIIRYPNSFEIDLSSCPQAPNNPGNPYSLVVVDEGDVGLDHYISFAGPANSIKFKRRA